MFKSGSYFVHVPYRDKFDFQDDKELQRQFDELDADKDGLVTKKEVFMFLKDFHASEVERIWHFMEEDGFVS